MAKSNSHDEETLSPASSVGSPPPFNGGIIMVSLPETQESLPQDVFLTPPEESSLPSSSAASGSYGDHCAVNIGVDVDATSQQFVNLYSGSLVKDSDLGFSEVEAQQKKEYSDLGKSPVEKSKLSEHELGKVEEVSMGSFKGKLVSEKSEISLNKNYSEKVACIDKGKKIAEDEIVEASGVGKSEMECGGSSEKEINVCDVLRVLLEGDDDDVEENLDHVTLLDVAKARGITFPAPRWWPDGDMFES